MKFSLTRPLYEKGYDRDYVINLLKVIDWTLVLPEDLELEYKSKVRELEEEKNMSYMTSFQQLGREEGRYEVAKNLLAEGMPIELVRKVTKLSDLDLDRLSDLDLAELEEA